MSPRVRSIIEDVADRWGIPFAEIMGRRGSLRAAAARHAAMRELRKLNTTGQFSYTAIGRIFKRHHTTVMAACGAIPGKQSRILTGPPYPVNKHGLSHLAIREAVQP